MMTALFVFIVCLCASTIGGICGIGGGVVIKPVLDATGVMSVTTASFLSGLTVLAMSLVSVWRNRNTRELDVRRGLPLGIGAAIGGVAGKRLFELIKAAANADALVGAVQSIVLALLVLGTFLYMKNKARIRPKNVQNPAGAVLVGLFLGVCSAFLGIGGGPMNLVVLHYFFSMETKTAAVNSLLVIFVSQIASLLATVVTNSVPDFEVTLLMVMVLAGVLGGIISTRLHRKLSAKQTDFLFFCLLAVILLICVYNIVTKLMQV